MLVNGKNECIQCTIGNCTYHANGENYCTLEKIMVGTNQTNPTNKESTDCQSFIMRG